MKYPNSILKLIDELKRFPGIGEKTAQRLALFVVNKMESEHVESLSEALLMTKSAITFCPICGTFMEESCPICDNPNRNQKTIMVVESISDLIIIENGENYHGLYHVLGGTIDFTKGIEPQDLNIDSLLKRVAKVDEIILALNGAVDGQLTSSYIQELLKEKTVKVTKIAHGIPVGGDLSYADQRTLAIALENRITLKE